MIVAFTGKSGSGKTTIARATMRRLCSAGISAAVMSFATPIKKIAKECFGWDGKKDERGRRLLQVIGTEAGRLYNPNIWVDDLFRKTEEVIAISRKFVVLIDDCRFDNESTAVLSRGGDVIRLIGRGGVTGEMNNHSSEVGLLDSLVTKTIDNSKDGEEEIASIAECIIDEFIVCPFEEEK